MDNPFGTLARAGEIFRLFASHTYFHQRRPSHVPPLLSSCATQTVLRNALCDPASSMHAFVRMRVCKACVAIGTARRTVRVSL